MMPNYSNLDVEARAEQAVTYFKSGYNCAQPVPSPRTDAYYKKRPCVELVRMSATFIGEELKKL